MKFVCSLTVVSDIKRSRIFYENILKQKVKYDFGENICFEGDFAIHLKSHFSNLIGNKEILLGGNSSELYFEDDNLEELIQRIRDHDVKIIHEIKEQPWKQRVIRFYDPDNNIIEVGETMEFLCYRLYKEGYKNIMIKEMTSMSEEFIQNSIEIYEKRTGQSK